ncbi:P1 family peptidase [Aestuariivirga sp.]|uniref:P1 family peptidase n=1 Tax=Aestuariivirga sp. TaxID=2650926 RepID=UPI0039E60C1A
MRNLITDVPGLSVGQAEDAAGVTGTTILLPDVGAMVMACDIRGGAPGTRETEALKPENLVEQVHGLVLTGGSVFGLDAASELAVLLARKGLGFKFGDQAWPCPVVPAAVLFDLMNGGNKAWGEEPPYRRLAREAFARVGKDMRLGNAGAGMGATAGALKGGLGSASATIEGFTVGAIVAVNSLGSCINPRTGLLWAIDHAENDEMGPVTPLAGIPPAIHRSKLDALMAAARPGANTTIAAVATDATLTKSEAKRLAIMAADGFGIAIRPAHTPFDGDSVFAISTAQRVIEGDRALMLARLGAAAATTLARAIGRAIWEAQAIGALTSYRSLAQR